MDKGMNSLADAFDQGGRSWEAEGCDEPGRALSLLGAPGAGGVRGACPAQTEASALQTPLGPAPGC